VDLVLRARAAAVQLPRAAVGVPPRPWAGQLRQQGGSNAQRTWVERTRDSSSRVYVWSSSRTGPAVARLRRHEARW